MFPLTFEYYLNPETKFHETGKPKGKLTYCIRSSSLHSFSKKNTKFPWHTFSLFCGDCVGFWKWRSLLKSHFWCLFAVGPWVKSLWASLLIWSMGFAITPEVAIVGSLAWCPVHCPYHGRDGFRHWTCCQWHLTGNAMLTSNDSCKF